MAAVRNVVVLLAGLLLAAAHQQGLRSAGSQTAQAEDKGIVDDVEGMLAKMGQLFTWSPGEQMIQSADAVQNNASKSGGGKVISVPLNSELQEGKVVTRHGRPMLLETS
ncbi:unnamed protein product [Polarella glacialis]|uniref:Uncharacterized protein n=1 Tax=Polarella glacialis TaxID=89957 RepID=A0A813F409_POLGL|nr:unnamed protein product [Polarella glacialis]|mmetsp:Transcript_55016/g.88909  ORF Transcript_55016/g.88909 Transcript_55016/m.88909 type:complete len:109 (+) Transcript_55016:111-437(+)